jgi:competence ComEA-like helix-hairpin-helix protein
MPFAAGRVENRPAVELACETKGEVDEPPAFSCRTSASGTDPPGTRFPDEWRPAVPKEIAGDEGLVMLEPIDLNTASGDELMQLQDISASAAQRLVEYRAQKGRFESLDELAEVQGVSDRIIDQIREQVTVGPGNMADWHQRWLGRGRP